jgi:hypothetical protein
MQLKKTRIQQIIREELQRVLSEVSVPTGFTRLDRFPDQDESIAMLKDETPGTYAVNNGTIVIIPQDGIPAVWLSGHDRQAARTLTFKQALASVEEMGYERVNFHVPAL